LDLVVHLDLSKQEVIKRRSAAGSAAAPNPNPCTVEDCEKFLWPAHERYLIKSVDNLASRFPALPLTRIGASEMKFNEIQKEALTAFAKAASESMGAGQRKKAKMTDVEAQMIDAVQQVIAAVRSSPLAHLQVELNHELQGVSLLGKAGRGRGLDEAGARVI
jgi:hypothetical protein